MQPFAKTTMLPVLLVAALLASSSTPVPGQEKKNSELIVGKWDIGMNTIFEYRKDGTMLMTIGKVEVPGKYKFINNDTMEVEITFMGKTKSNRLKVVIKGDEMTTTDPEGKSNKLTRVK
jgi:uncharacterized protein (TIGR03066 family)